MLEVSDNFTDNFSEIFPFGLTVPTPKSRRLTTQYQAWEAVFWVVLKAVQETPKTLWAVALSYTPPHKDCKSLLLKKPCTSDTAQRPKSWNWPGSLLEDYLHTIKRYPASFRRRGPTNLPTYSYDRHDDQHGSGGTQTLVVTSSSLIRLKSHPAQGESCLVLEPSPFLVLVKSVVLEKSLQPPL